MSVRLLQLRGMKINDAFGIPESHARELIDGISADWTLLASGTAGETFTLCSLFKKIMADKTYTEPERCFLCAHVADKWTLFQVMYYIDKGDIVGIFDLLGIKPS